MFELSHSGHSIFLMLFFMICFKTIYLRSTSKRTMNPYSTIIAAKTMPRYKFIKINYFWN